MSDVNISTSWSSLPSSDTEYNTVLGVAGYNTDDERLFLSAQQVPGIARNVTTEYARGFRITSGYDGLVLHDAITETSADLKTVRVTMSIAGSAYDLEDARLYAQFKNLYSVDISSWTLYAEADDETQTLIASGGTISAGAALQVDFNNDYGAVRYILVFEYTGGKHVEGWNLIKLAPAESTDRILGNWNRGWTITNNTDNNIYFCAPRGELVCALPESNSQTGTIRYELFNDTGSGGRISYRDLSSARYNGTQLYYYYGESSIAKYPTDNPAVSGDGWAWMNAINEAGGLVAGGLNTADLSSYTGDMWQCRLIANIAAISPGPMATESEGGTEGDFDVTSDQIAAPDIPSTYTQSYFGHIYLIDNDNLSAVASIINSTDFLDQIYTNFGDIAKCIVSVSQFPISAYSGVGPLGDITVGSKRIASASLTPRARPLSRFAQVYCGTVDLHLFWDSALDLNPYTKLSIYIPCVGMRPLDADVVMGHTLGLYYNVDYMTGNALAILTLDGDYYDQYSCTLATQYALNTEQWGPVYQGIMSTLSTGAIGFAVSGSGGAVAGALAGAATQSIAQKLHHDKAGTMGASMSLFTQLQPYVEILRPIQQLPRDYTKFNAYPSYMTSQLINLSGYVEVQDIRLDDIDCTDAERTELMDMLQSGVIL